MSTNPTIAAFYDYEIWKMDVKNAFLNGYLDEDIYMVQPEGFILNIPEKIDNFKRGNIVMQESLDLNKTQGASKPEEVKRMQNVTYASVVGSIIEMDDLKKLKSLKENDNKLDPRVYMVDVKPLKSIFKKPKQHGMNFEADTTKEDAMNTKNKEEVSPSRISIAPEVSVREFYITLSSNYDESTMVAAIEDVNGRHQDQNFEKHGSPCNMGNKSYVDLFNDEDGLSLIATQISKPLMLDAYTSFMCGEAWGRINFARALIEVSSDSDLKKEVTMVIPNEDEMDYTREVISVEYEWQPPRCVDCKKFCHSSDRCPKIIREPITPVYIDTNSDGFKEVQRKKINDKKVDLQPRLRQRDGKGPSTSNSFNVLNTMDVEDKSGTPSSRCNQEEEHEERIKELDEFDEDVDEFIFPEEIPKRNLELLAIAMLD
ncbi:zinc knuckle CX2CX4HX4C containing protein [Tanacetum coccineum]